MNVSGEKKQCQTVKNDYLVVNLDKSQDFVCFSLTIFMLNGRCGVLCEKIIGHILNPIRVFL